MNQILAIPMEVRLAVLFVLGSCVGSLANLGIYRLAWHPRSISPWWRPDPKAPPRRWSDRLPIIGWLGLRREAGLHGTGFWIRPMLAELLTGIGFAALYWWQVGQAGLLPAELPRPAPPGMLALLHLQYAAHLLLITLMLIASMIDVDEQTIPDSITVPGALLGLLLALGCPRSLLPAVVIPPGVRVPANFWQQIDLDKWPFLQLTSPNQWPNWLAGFPQAWSLVVGLGCWWLWCVALMPRAWYSRYGRRRAFQFFVAKLARESATYWILLMGLAGSAAIAAAWFCGGLAWMGLLSGLIGLAAGGGLIWLVRIIGTAVLRREAMGFGDVTLMAMVGAFLGWQTCLMVFFLAPFAALVVGVLQLILRRGSVIPYGPFLCLATAASIVCWATIWDRTWAVFALGWIVPLMVLACMVLLALLLALMQLIRRVFQ